MPRNLKRNAVASLVLATLFYASFLFAKQDPALRGVIPFGEDPYDAIGSFGVVIAPLIALVSLVRAFRPYPVGAPSTAQRVYLVRAQAAVVLAVYIALVADMVAMARHPDMWVGAASRNELLALLTALGLTAVAAQLLIRATHETLPEGGGHSLAARRVCRSIGLADTCGLTGAADQRHRHASNYRCRRCCIALCADEAAAECPGAVWRRRGRERPLVHRTPTLGRRLASRVADRRFLIFGRNEGGCAAKWPPAVCCVSVCWPGHRGASHRLCVSGKTAGTCTATQPINTASSAPAHPLS